MEEKKSLSWARKRQIITILIVLAFLLLVAAGIYFLFFSKEPSCLDGKMNGEETGIDCGGKCALVCSGIAKEPVIEFTRLFKGIRGYSAVAHIENQNDLIARSAEYTFKLYDANGALVGERTGSIFIPRRKSMPIYEPNIDTKGVEPSKVLFAFKNRIVWEKSDYEEPKLVVEDERLYGEKTSPRFIANILNPTVNDIQNINMVVVMYDDAGNAVNASRTTIDRISPKQKIPIVYTWPYPFPETVHVCAQPVDVAVAIDRSGSMAFLSKEPPQPLTDIKNAAMTFVRQLNDKAQASFVSFANTGTGDISLTTDVNKVAASIDVLSIHTDGSQNTNIADGLAKAYNELVGANHNPASLRAIVLLTDGVPTLPVKNGDPLFPEKSAIVIAENIKKEGINIFTIGLGKDLNKELLSTIATTPDHAYFAPTAADVTAIYQSIGTKICKKGTSRIEIDPQIPLPASF